MNGNTMVRIAPDVPSLDEAFGTRAAGFRESGLWAGDSLAFWLDHWAREKADDPFVTDGELTLTWSQVRARAYRAASSFRAMGIGHGDRVAVQLPNWHEFTTVYFALARIGAILVPALPVYRAKEIRQFVELTSAKAYVITPSFRGHDYLAMARDIRPQLPSLREVLVVRAPGDLVLEPGECRLEELTAADEIPDADQLGPVPDADDGHIIGFTSGTESQAKGCFHTWNTYSRSPRVQGALYHFGAEDCELVPSPITHTGGLAGGLLKAFLAGGRVCLMDVWDPARALELIDQHGCTQATGATAFIAGLVEAGQRSDGAAGRPRHSLRYFISGGAPVPEQLVRRTREVFPSCQLITCFGQTEGLAITSCVPEDPDIKVVSSDGRPTPGVEVEIRDDDGEPLEPGQVGNILYRGPASMLAYWRNPDATEAVIAPDGWRRSGDLGFLDADGYLRITGRAKEMIIRGGMNISTREIEELLSQHPNVAAAAVIGVPDPVLGERACAFVVPAGQHSVTLPELVTYLLETHQLAKPKLPERLEIIDALPVTATGKVQKGALRERLAG